MQQLARSKMLRATLLTGLIALYAIAAAGSGLDRIADDSPAVARIVPAPFRAGAERSAAAAALAREDLGPALDHAQAAVAADPANGDASALLATAQLLNGNAAGADRAMRVAARFGWRNLATQVYWYHVALQADDFEVAVDRADAILRIAPAFPERAALLAPLEEDPAARGILVRHLAERPLWLTSYLAGPADSGNALLRRRAMIAEALAQGRDWTGCAEFDGLVRKLLLRGDRATAEHLWNTACPEMAVPAGLADGNFRFLGSRSRHPFGWVVERSGDVAFRVGPAGRVRTDGHAVAMRNTGAATELVLHQAVNLKPGAYLLRADVAGDREALAATLGCGASAPFPGKTVGDLAGSGQPVQGRDCGAQTLALWLRPGRGEILLRAISLEPSR